MPSDASVVAGVENPSGVVPFCVTGLPVTAAVASVVGICEIPGTVGSVEEVGNAAELSTVVVGDISAAGVVKLVGVTASEVC